MLGANMFSIPTPAARFEAYESDQLPPAAPLPLDSGRESRVGSRESQAPWPMAISQPDKTSVCRRCDMVVPDSCSRDCRGEALAAPCAPAAARGARAMQACNQVSGPRSIPIGCTLPMCGRGFKPMAVPNYPLFVRSSSAKTVSANEPVPAGHPAVPSHTRLPSAPPFFDHPSSNLALALALDLTNTRRGSHCNRCTRPQRPASIQIPTTTTPLFTTVALALSASPSRRFWPSTHVALTINQRRCRPQHR